MKFTITIEKDKHSFIARCLEVDLVSQGKTEGTALDNIQEALELYLEKPSKTPLSKKHVNVATVEVGK
ncbi:type II toxin-antitoxin system HicB family antitoxin [Candidatus Woesearchaeota archaeon]|nr:type II toxin-antitoxin system HicB family antitoxin [Candidatus Woesearchaeota archaeon]